MSIEATYLISLVRDKITELGTARAAEYFGAEQRNVEKWTRERQPPLWAIEKVLLDKNDERKDIALPSTGGPVIGANWQGKNVLLCLPWYKQVSPFTCLSLLAIAERDKMGYLMASGDAFISHTRNKLAQAFLETDAEWSLWVDDDMILPMGKSEWFLQTTGARIRPEWAGLHTINRLLSHGKPLVGALYTGRQREGRLMFAEGASDPRVSDDIRRNGPRNECRATRWVATGCLLIHRKVFEGINKKFPHLKQNFFSPSEHDLVSATEEISRVLTDSLLSPEQRIQQCVQLLEKGRVLSNTNSRVGVGEDVIFCVRAGQAGFQAHIDLGLVCGHQGSEIYGIWNTTTPAPGL